MQDTNYQSLYFIPLALSVLILRQFYFSLESGERFIFWGLVVSIAAILFIWILRTRTPNGKKNVKRLEVLNVIPEELLKPSAAAVTVGTDIDLEAKIYLPDHIRTRHVHIVGVTGSGKTESVILNFLKQDVARGLGSIVLDAKGDQSFLDELNAWVPKHRLFIFDLSSSESTGYNPLEHGSPLESAQRLFSSLTWSEEYYKSKALSALQQLFQVHFEINGQNPTLVELSQYLRSPDSYSSFIQSESAGSSAKQEFQELSGLRDQIRSLTLGHLENTLSPIGEGQLDISAAATGAVLYFRLQSLMSPQLVSAVGKLVINHLNYFVGTAHRERVHAKQRKLVPVYVDEFASFACPEFADLISKARSAGFALHFSHQSIGDVMDVSDGFLGRITDNSATKIILRVSDPDSAEFFARCFGTKDIQKTTQRITNAKEIESAEVVGEGTTRDAHQFRASPDTLKTLPTGSGVMLVAHGRATPHGASSIFKIQFPLLNESPSTNLKN